MTDSALPSEPPESPPPIPAPLRETPRWRWLIHLFVIGSYPALGLFFRTTSGRVGQGPALSGNVRGLLVVSAAEIIVFSIFFAVACLVSRASREQLMLGWRPGWWVVPLGIGYSVALRIGLIVIAVAVMAVVAATQTVTPEKVQEYVTANRPDVEALVSVPAMRTNPAYYWLTITLVSFVVAGVREEMWRAGTLAAMRALWPRAFSSILGQCLAIALIAVAFGAMHLRMGVLAAIGAGVLGLMLGIIIILHKSIWPAVIAHGLFDATTLALLPWWIEKARQLH
ncbi:MAG: CPBP family intramembrane metalloprotease [Verrucomicrobiota bacterium]|nr:CPBP family intramembrane metalloprotease [Verrucomicrobiota bacterium]